MRVAYGASMSVATAWELGKHWYADRLEHEWRTKTPEQIRETLSRVGLVGPFWELA